MTIGELQDYLEIAARESKLGENAPVKFWDNCSDLNLVLDNDYAGKTSSKSCLNFYGELVLHIIREENKG